MSEPSWPETTPCASLHGPRSSQRGGFPKRGIGSSAPGLRERAKSSGTNELRHFKKVPPAIVQCHIIPEPAGPGGCAWPWGQVLHDHKPILAHTIFFDLSR